LWRFWEKSEKYIGIKNIVDSPTELLYLITSIAP
jgi:hypothetical protein